MVSPIKCGIAALASPRLQWLACRANALSPTQANPAGSSRHKDRFAKLQPCSLEQGHTKP